MRLCLIATAALCVAAETPQAVFSLRSTDSALTADPDDRAWTNATHILADRDAFARPVPGHRTEIRSRWSRDNLYFMFVCPYQTLYLKPKPETNTETNHLWDWDVAEIFIGPDFQNIYRYKEFEVSPQSEWVDLDIDRKNPLPEGGWLWNSGFESKARIDSNRKIWYAEMKIPFRALGIENPHVGQRFRVNFYRMQGPPPDRKEIAWQPTHSESFHVPEAFGILELQ